MMESSDLLAKVMEFDPLARAEEISGERAEDGTIGFSTALFMVHAKSSCMRSLLSERGDVWDGMPLDEYLRFIESYGFERLLVDSFESRYASEKFFVYAHRDGLLLAFDTFMARQVNGGNIYYCWKPTREEGFYHLTSSGRFIAPEYEVWAGYHDAREAVIFNMERLRENGRFITPWPNRPFLWLLHYQESKARDYDRTAINEERISRFPQWARDMVGANDE